MNKSCLGYVAPGTLDLPKRDIHTRDPKAMCDEFPRNRLARPASQIKHRRSFG